ncbi:hypothetical protein CHS0354_013142 [Potamilus streckersoni]|uniref:Argininosuccinate synthase n=1 Tax=Potamilus streckersoni TaxID=2493646 RepID=A0AAE0S6A7_9BIVA|nr:hypothetical protein CHS0354_013142 [Potamilus streckersoni]
MSDFKIYYENDANIQLLKSKKLAIIGYGSQGHAHALNLKESGMDVVVGLHAQSKSIEKVKQDGLIVKTVDEAAAWADMIMILAPDQTQKSIYDKSIAHNLKAGKILAFGHGFNIHYSQILPPPDVDVVMIAPKGPGHLVRRTYKEGSGVPCLVCVHQDASGKAFDYGMAWAQGIGGTRAGVIRTTFKDETETDLFGEQAVLCGGVSELIRAGFETLTDAGYPPEISYFECLHELKLIVDLMYEGGINGMNYSVSETAEYGGLLRVPGRYENDFEEVRSGKFAKEWLLENQIGQPHFKGMRAASENHPVEKQRLDLLEKEFASFRQSTNKTDHDSGPSKGCKHSYKNIFNLFMQKEKVVLAYSGGLDTSVIVSWMAEQGYEVYALCLDLGQKIEDLDAIRKKGFTAGAKDVLVENVQEEFVRDYVFPSLMMNAVYEGTYLLGTSLARPLIAKKQIEYAKKIGATAVAHGATGKGNDQVRFEMGYLSLMPDVKIIAPWKIPEFFQKYPGRAELIEYAQQKNIPVKATKSQPWSSDENLMHISFESGMLEDPWVKPLKEMFELSVDPKDAPDAYTEVTLEYEKGVPAALNGKRLKPHQLLDELNTIAGKNGVGLARVYETPGGTVLLAAHRAIESITLTRDVIDLKDSLMPRFSKNVYNGFWFTPEMELIRAMALQSQEPVTGTVRLELYKGMYMSRGVSLRTVCMTKILHQWSGIRDVITAGCQRIYRLNALPYRIYNRIKAKHKIAHEVGEEFSSYRGRGYSISEVSHRSDIFEEVLFETIKDLRTLMAIPDNYHVYEFYYGGAELCANKIPAYIDTGVWAKKAIIEAQKLYNIQIAATSEPTGYDRIPNLNGISLKPGTDYVHITTNNTIYGSQYHQIPDFGGVPVIADMTSDILGREMNVKETGMIYAGAQKNLGISGMSVAIIRDDLLKRIPNNLPTMFDYNSYVKNDSMHNTPNTFAIYVCGKVLKWVMRRGGVKKMVEINRKKAEILYRIIDNSNIYTNRVVKEDRSTMNVPFFLSTPELEAKFLAEAEQRDLLFLKGHKITGGIRASIYNATEMNSVEALAEFMTDFEKRAR